MTGRQLWREVAIAQWERRRVYAVAMYSPSNRVVAVFAVLVLFAACSDENKSAAPSTDTAIARLEVSPSSVLATASGQTAQLQIRAYNAAGAIVDAGQVQFTSSADAFSVDASGLVTATQPVGSALVTARSGDVSSKPVFAAAVTLASGVRLLSDAEIATTPTLIDPLDRFRVGALYSVGLTTAELPAVGDLIASSGEKVVAGRVIGVDGGTVTYEVVALTTLFTAVSIDVAYDPDTLASQFVSADNPDALSAIECESDLAQGLLRPEIELSVDPSIALTLAYDYSNNIVQRFVARATGGIEFDAHATLGIGAAFTGEVECVAHLGTIIVPITGPLAAFLAPVIPLNAFISGEVTASVAEVNLGLAWSPTIDVDMGFAWVHPGPGSQAFNQLNFSADPPEPIIQLGDENALRVEAELFAGLATGVSFGNLLTSLSLISLQAGPQLEAKFGGIFDAAADPTFDTGYELKVALELSPGEDAEAFIESISLMDGVDFSAKTEMPFAGSPGVDNATVDAGTFAVGDTLNFHLELESSALPFFGYNVAEIRVYYIDRARSAATLIATRAAADGAVAFDIPWTATFAGSTGTSDDPTFVPFVVDKLLGVITQQFPFELDGFEGTDLEIRPQKGQVAPGEVFAFTAFADNQQVGAGYTWSATGGDISGTGDYTAGTTPGEYEVRITNNATQVSAAAAIIVTNMKITPDVASVPPSATQQFTALYAGVAMENAVWTATGGTIDSTGLFTAGTERGVFEVRVTSTDHAGEYATATINVGTLCSKTGSEAYCIFPLPVIPGSSDRWCGKVINDAGEVGGQRFVYEPDASYSQGFVYHPDGSITRYQDFRGDHTGATVEALAQNGRAVGSASHPDVTPYSPYWWNGPTPGYPASWPYPYEHGVSTGVSSSESMVALMVNPADSTDAVITIWVGADHYLPILPEGARPAANPRMNDSGEVVAIANFEALHSGTAYRIQNNTNVIELPRYLGQSAGAAFMSAIADNGLIAITQWLGRSADDRYLPIIYEGTTPTVVETERAGWLAQAHGVNNQGTVVGTLFDRANAAFTCPAVRHNGVMTCISKLIPQNSGWTIEQATSINNLGQIAVCGSFPGGRGGAILQPVN